VRVDDVRGVAGFILPGDFVATAGQNCDLRFRPRESKLIANG